MKKRLTLLVVFAMLLSICVTQAFAAEPVNPTEPTLVMYANAHTAGNVVPVKIDPYTQFHPERLDPTNVYGEFDAVQMPGGEAALNANDFFFGLASREWTNYTFEDNFWNVNGVPDIEFSEVTWGNWHAEATLVYLTGAYIRDAKGNVVPYAGNDNGYGYYAGVAGNKVSILGFSDAQKAAIRAAYLPVGVSRDFYNNTYKVNGNFGLTQFYLPDEVVYATGITLVDITDEVWDYAPIGLTSTYENVAGSGRLVEYTGRTPGTSGLITDDIVSANTTVGYEGNTDGYDLDAIRVFRYTPGGNDSATGCNKLDGTGNKIKTKGTWFMYNTVNLTEPNSSVSFPIQAHNPLDGTRIIGSYTIVKNVDGTFTATYDIDDIISMNGYQYDIVVTAEHLGIDNDTTAMNFTANPGQDDNSDFGVPFVDADGNFYVFAHFAVEYR